MIMNVFHKCIHFTKLIISTVQITNFVDGKMKAVILSNSLHISLAYIYYYALHILVIKLKRSGIKKLKSERVIMLNFMIFKKSKDPSFLARV